MKILNNEKEVVTSIDFGIVEAGESKTLDYILFNDTNAKLIEIEVIPDHKEVEVVKSSKEIEPNKEGTFRLKWVPSINIKKGLKTTVKIKGLELYE